MCSATVHKKVKLLFVVTEDWYFCSHRLPLALGAIEAGFEVAVATRITNHSEIIRQAGIEIYPWNISRGSTGILNEFRALYRLLRIYKNVKPDLVHQVALKPVLYGSLVAKLAGVRKIVNALGGMGFVFNNGGKETRGLRTTILMGFKWLLSGKNNLLILQNPDDVDLMVNEAKVNTNTIRLIRGAGVNIQQFSESAELVQSPVVVLPARMLWDKGIGEFVEAAKLLKSEGVSARFVLVGGIDECNPTGITPNQLNAWIEAGWVEWVGRRDDMPEVLRHANIVCLPSYREGLPKALLEAAACGRAIVATDVPGCREIVRHGENGLLVPARDPNALSAALKKLILNPLLRRQMGLKGRNIVLSEFSEKTVVDHTIKVYKEILQMQIY